MIVFVGNKIRMGGLVSAAKERLREDVTFIDESYSIVKQENDILLAAKNGASCIVYDTNQYFDDGEEIISIIKRIYRANGIKPILLVPTNNPKNEILKCAVANQIKNFINTSCAIGEQKDEFEKIYADFYSGNKREDVAAVEEVVQDETKTLNAFVGELYDAKQREIEKENTVVIKQKGNLQVVIDFVVGLIKTLAMIVVIMLATVGLISLIYSSVRIELLEVLDAIYKGVIVMFK